MALFRQIKAPNTIAVINRGISKLKVSPGGGGGGTGGGTTCIKNANI
ncbi:hypothetical protein [uncultured Polaribacter sp.]|nr:hypothetical protein [uncultured Polaribacter sp.]